jgi:DNA mismatch repair ATPase MutL
MSKSKENFIKVPDNILSTNKLTSSQKLMISYVLRWQSSGKTCFESNNTLAKQFGLQLAAIKKQITALNKLPFFKSKETSGQNEHGKWVNSKKMVIDEIALNDFLQTVDKEEISEPDTTQPLVDETFLDDFESFKSYLMKYPTMKLKNRQFKVFFR